MLRARNWCFTLNNPGYALTPDVDFVYEGCPVTFMVWQLECGDEGTEHYQGYLELDRPCSLRQMHQLGAHSLLGAHFEVFILRLLFPPILRVRLEGFARPCLSLQCVLRLRRVLCI